MCQLGWLAGLRRRGRLGFVGSRGLDVGQLLESVRVNLHKHMVNIIIQTQAGLHTTTD